MASTPTNLPLLAVLACMHAETRSVGGRGSDTDLARRGFRQLRSLPRLRLADLVSRSQPNTFDSADRVVGLTARCLVGLPHNPDSPIPYETAVNIRADSGLSQLNFSAANACRDAATNVVRPYPNAVSQWIGAHTSGGFFDLGRAAESEDQSSYTARSSVGAYAGGLTLGDALEFFDPRVDWWDGAVAGKLGARLTMPCVAELRYKAGRADGTITDQMLASWELNGIPPQCVVWHVVGRPGRVPERNRHVLGAEDAVAVVINNAAQHPYEVLDIPASLKLTADTLFPDEFRDLLCETLGAADWAHVPLMQPPPDADQRYARYKPAAEKTAVRAVARAKQVLERLQHWLDGRGHWPTEPEAREELEARLRRNAVTRGYKFHEAHDLSAFEPAKRGRPAKAPDTPKAPAAPAVKKDELRADLADAQARIGAALALIKGDHDMLEPDNLMRPILAEYMAALVCAVPPTPDAP